MVAWCCAWCGLPSAGLAAWLLDLRSHAQRLPPAAPGAVAQSAAQPGSLLRRCFGHVMQRCTVRDPRMRLCETLPLGGRRSLALVECDGRRFLAGLSANGVETLLALDTPGSTAEGPGA